MQHVVLRGSVAVAISATDVIAVIALVAAILALALQFRESNRRDEEIRLLRAEAERHNEELRLLGQQVEAEQAERLRQQQARISVFEGVQTSGSERGIEYTVPVQNTGASVAAQIGVLRSDPP